MLSYRSSVATETQGRTSLCFERKKAPPLLIIGPYKGTRSLRGMIQGRALKLNEVFSVRVSLVRLFAVSLNYFKASLIMSAICG